MYPCLLKHIGRGSGGLESATLTVDMSAIFKTGTGKFLKLKIEQIRGGVQIIESTTKRGTCANPNVLICNENA